MGNWLSFRSRPVLLSGAVMLFILLCVSIFFLKKNTFSWETVVDSQQSLRSRIRNTNYHHPLLQRQQQLFGYSVKQQTIDSLLTISIPESISYSGITVSLPQLSGFITIQGSNTYTAQQGSGSINLAARINTQDISWQSNYDFNATLESIWNTNTIRFRIRDIQFNQSWTQHDDILLAVAYLHEYEDTWIQNTWSAIQNIFRAALFEGLSNQKKQHIIPTLSWWLDLLIEWAKIGMNASIMPSWLFQGFFKFPQHGIRAQFQEQEDASYTMVIKHYRVPTALFNGTVFLTAKIWWLETIISWTGWFTEAIQRSLQHNSIIKPSKSISITTPSHSLEREKVIALWKKQSEKQ